MDGDGGDLRLFVDAIGSWFSRAQRDLSWRRTRDPYAVWVSEVMLQQTRVETVERYYGPFMRIFPDVATLAAASEDRVLQIWSGLGYYRRARLLHAGARHVMGAFGGRLPYSVEKLREIPGIGRYTAGAISNIAFDKPAPLVDGNIARVLSRVGGITCPKRQGAGAAEHWRVAGALVQLGRPRVLAQALMELGAIVCTPRTPDCPRCPVRIHCHAHREGLVASIPTPVRKGPVPIERYVALGIVVRGRLLLCQRPRPGLLEGMWCVPLLPWGDEGPVVADDSPFSAIPLPSMTPAPPVVRHVFTHRIWEISPMKLKLANRGALRSLPRQQTAWIAKGDVPVGGIPSVTRKLLNRLAFSGAPSDAQTAE